MIYWELRNGWGGRSISLSAAGNRRKLIDYARRWRLDLRARIARLLPPPQAWLVFCHRRHGSRRLRRSLENLEQRQGFHSCSKNRVRLPRPAEEAHDSNSPVDKCYGRRVHGHTCWTMVVEALVVMFVIIECFKLWSLGELIKDWWNLIVSIICYNWFNYRGRKKWNQRVK